MEGVKAWGMGVCLSLLVGAAVHMMSPSAGMQKILKIVVAVFLISAMFYPLLNLGGGLELTLAELSEGNMQDSYDSIQQEMNRQVLSSSERTMERLVREKMMEFDVEPLEVSARAELSEDGSILIKEIIITLAPEYISNKYVVTERLKQQLGVDCTVVEG